MKPLLFIVGCIFGTLLYVLMVNTAHAEQPLPTRMVCKDVTTNDLFFVNLPEGLLLLGFGFNGIANTLVVIDTAGKVHELHDNEPDHVCAFLYRRGPAV